MDGQLLHAIVAETCLALIPQCGGRLTRLARHRLDQGDLRARGIVEREPRHFLDAQHFPGFVFVVDDMQDDEAAGQQVINQLTEVTAVGFEFIEEQGEAVAVLNDIRTRPRRRRDRRAHLRSRLAPE